MLINICATQMQLIIHISFLCKCPQMNGMSRWLFIHSLMDDFVFVLCNLFTTSIPLVIHVNCFLKCCGQI